MTRPDLVGVWLIGAFIVGLVALVVLTLWAALTSPLLEGMVAVAVFVIGPVIVGWLYLAVTDSEVVVDG